MNTSVLNKPDRTTELLGPRARDLKSLLGDLYQPKASVYGSDFLACVALGWAGFAYLYLASAPGFHWSALVAWIVATFAFYRGLMFAHELSHFQRGVLPRFRVGWNLLLGAPLMFPSAFYEGMHLDHHHAKKCGTKADTEYDDLAGQKPRSSS